MTTGSSMIPSRGVTVPLLLVLLMLAGTIAAASPDLEAGRQAFRQGQYAAAFRVLEPLAQQGSPDAQFLLGEMFLHGHALPEDPAEAALLFRRAADQDHADAQFALAGLLSVGRGVDRNARQAAKWNLKAANHGHGEAQLQMGYRYDLGDGVPVDRRAAAGWYVRATESGIVDSNLGLAYCSGSGVKQDLVAGHFWLSVYLEWHPDDDEIRQVRSYCAEEMSPAEIEQAQARFSDWRNE